MQAAKGRFPARPPMTFAILNDYLAIRGDMTPALAL
jgi:hypothetical protein